MAENEEELWLEKFFRDFKAGIIKSEPNENESGTVEFSNGLNIPLKTLVRNFAKDSLHYYYDDKEQIYWICKELYDKAHQVQYRDEKSDIGRD